MTLKAGVMTRTYGGENVMGNFKAAGDIGFGAPLKLSGDDIVDVFDGGTFIGFAARDPNMSFTRDANGMAVETQGYKAGDQVLVAKRGVIALKVAAAVTRGKKVAIKGDGTIADEDATGYTALEGTMFLASGAADSVVEAEINLPA